MGLKIVFLYNQGPRGWTETYYSSSTVQPKTFAQNITSTTILLALAIRAPGTRLVAIRVSNVGGVRRSYPRLIGQNAPPDSAFGVGYDNPDVVSTDAVYSIISTSGTRRAVAFRGIRDADIVRQADGTDAPSARLSQKIDQFIANIKLNGWAVRSEVRPPDDGFTYWNVLAVSSHVGGAGLTDLLVDTAPPSVLDLPLEVTFLGVPRNDLPGFPKKAAIILTTATPAQCTIGYRYRGSAAITVPIGMRFTALDYSYSSIDDWGFDRFSERKTGRPFGQPRGRERAVVKRK